MTIRFAWRGSQKRADKTNKVVELFMEKNMPREDLQKLKESRLKHGGDDMFERGFIFEYFCRQHGENPFSSTKESTIDFSEDTYVDYYKLD